MVARGRTGEREARDAVGKLARQHAADRAKAGNGDAGHGGLLFRRLGEWRIVCVPGSAVTLISLLTHIKLVTIPATNMRRVSAMPWRPPGGRPFEPAHKRVYARGKRQLDPHVTT